MSEGVKRRSGDEIACAMSGAPAAGVRYGKPCGASDVRPSSKAVGEEALHLPALQGQGWRSWYATRKC